MSEQVKGVAFFDFDGTISFEDSFLEFFKYTDGSLKLYWCVLLNSPFVLLYFLKLYSNHKLKVRFFSFFYKGRAVAELEEKGKVYSRTVLPKMVYPQALQLIRWHLEHGHQVYLLTASSRLWLGEWCRQQNMKIIDTTFESDGKYYTGKIAGENCYGKEKATQIQSILAANKGIPSYGYGHGSGDAYFIAEVKYGFNMPLNAINITPQWFAALKEN
jgi:HAD superfamily hydrolase (TIGR01490 family)